MELLACPADPNDWTVDDVVEAFCSEHGPFATKLGGFNLTALEATLRLNHVSGNVLLTECHKYEVLKSDLGLVSLGHRSMFRTEVLRLVGTSEGWHKENQSLQNVRALLNVEESPARSHRGSINSSSTPTPTIGARRELEEKPLLRSLSNFDEAPMVTESFSPTPVNQHYTRPRSPSTMVTSTNGTSHEQASLGNELTAATRNQEAPPHKKRRVNPRFIAPIQQSVQSQATLQPEPEMWDDDGLSGYLGQRSLPVNRLFYDDTPIGAEVYHKALTLHPAEVKALRRETESGAPLLERWDTGGDDKFDNTEVVLYIGDADGLRKSGRSVHVNSRMKHFLLQSDASLPVRYMQTDSRRAEASREFEKGYEFGIVPYQGRLVKDTTAHPSMTIYTRGKAKRVRLQDWKELDPVRAAVEDQYDELQARWTKAPDDEINLPLYGDSGSEGNVYSDSDDEEEDSSAAPKMKNESLTDERINAIIEEETKKFIESWKTSHLPQLELKARSLWQEARNALWLAVEKSKKHLEMLEDRLEYLTSNLMGNSYESAVDVRKQCGSFEITVVDKATTEWKLDLYKQPQSPPRPRRSLLEKIRTRASRKAADLGSGEEDLLSDEEFRIDEDLDDFIDDSNGEMHDGSHIPKQNSSYPNLDRRLEGQDEEANQETLGVAESVEHDLDDLQRDEGRSDSIQPQDLDIDPMDLDNKQNVQGQDLGNGSMDLEDEDASATQRQDDSSDPLLGDRQTLSRSQSSIPASSAEPRSLSLAPSPPLSPPSNIIKLPSNIAKGSPGTRSPTPEARDAPNVIDGLAEHEDADGTENEADDGHVPISRHAGIFSSDMEPEQSDRVNPSKMSKLDFPAPNDFARLRKMGPKARQFMCEHSRLHLLAYLMAYAKTRWKKVGSVAEGKMWSEMVHKVWSALDTLKTSPEEDPSGVMQIATWFVAWFCRYIPNEKGIKVSTINETRTNGKSEFKEFWGHLEEVLLLCKQNFTKPLPTTQLLHKPSFKKKSGDLTPPTTKSCKTKQTRSGWKKKESTDTQDAAEWRQMAAERQKADQKRREVLLKFMAKGKDGDQPVIINQGKADHEDFIEVNRHIASRIKPHQIDGINFIWREVVGAQEGLLLAHDMGLGKTMQCITALVTIAEAVKSQNVNIQQQIPKSLRTSQTLIVCPPTLVDNWHDELLKWVPEPHEDLIGGIRMVNTNLKSKMARLLEIEEWKDKGGVLLISYSLLSQLINNKEREQKDSSKSPKPLTDEQHQFVREALLDLPNLVIADEAQHFKNPDSLKSQVMRKFKTKIRIALTGSPLANNLAEYFHILDWASHGYLGEYAEFHEEFGKPISQGVYKDASNYTKRKALKSLKVLEHLLLPKVHRANYSVLRGQMNRKTEYLLYLSPTQIQKQCYDLFTQSIGKGGLENVNQANILAWIGLLKLICNHPSCFANRLKPNTERKAGKGTNDTVERTDRARKESPKTTGEVLDEVAEEASQTSIKHIGLSNKMIKEQLELFAMLTPEKVNELEASQKMVLLFLVLKFAKKAKEKTLVFSHSIATLNYVEKQLSKEKYVVARIDGTIPTTKRQDISKNFNEVEGDVLLISTMAGGAGLNLFGASRVVIMDDSFNPMNEQQAIGRAYRIGQQKDVFVYRLLVAGSFEEQMQNQGVHKLHLAQRVVDKEEPVRVAMQTMGQYVNPLQTRDTQSKSTLEAFAEKDPHVLQKAIQYQENLFTIQWIVEAESFSVEEKEELTADEAAEALKEAKKRQLRRENPELYNQQQREEQQQAFRALQQPAPTGPLQTSSSHLTYEGANPWLPQTQPSNVHHGLPSVQAHLPQLQRTEPLHQQHESAPRVTELSTKQHQSVPRVTDTSTQQASIEPSSPPNLRLTNVPRALRDSKIIELSKALKITEATLGTIPKIAGQGSIAQPAKQAESNDYQRAESDADYVLSISHEIEKVQDRLRQGSHRQARTVLKDPTTNPKFSSINLDDDMSKPRSLSPKDLSDNQRNTTGRDGRMQAVNEIRKEGDKTNTATLARNDIDIKNERPPNSRISKHQTPIFKAGFRAAQATNKTNLGVISLLSSEEDEDEAPATMAVPKISVRKSRSPVPGGLSFQLPSSKKRSHISSSEDESPPDAAQKQKFKTKKDTKVPKRDVFAPLARKNDKNGAAPTAPMVAKKGPKATGLATPSSATAQQKQKTPNFGDFMGLRDAYKLGINQPALNAKKGD